MRKSSETKTGGNANLKKGSSKKLTKGYGSNSIHIHSTRSGPQRIKRNQKFFQESRGTFKSKSCQAAYLTSTIPKWAYNPKEDSLASSLFLL